MADFRGGVGHVHLKVRDLEASVEFYVSLLGLEPSDRHGRFVFLTRSETDHHHDVALQEVGSDAEPPPEKCTGLYHTAFEVESLSSLKRVYRDLSERGVEATSVDNRISKSLYFDDPDGNGVEVYLDTRDENDRQSWDGTTETLDIEGI